MAVRRATVATRPTPETPSHQNEPARFARSWIDADKADVPNRLYSRTSARDSPAVHADKFRHGAQHAPVSVVKSVPPWSIAPFISASCQTPRPDGNRWLSPAATDH